MIPWPNVSTVTSLFQLLMLTLPANSVVPIPSILLHSGLMPTLLVGDSIVSRVAMDMYCSCDMSRDFPSGQVIAGYVVKNGNKEDWELIGSRSPQDAQV